MLSSFSKIPIYIAIAVPCLIGGYIWSILSPVPVPVDAAIFTMITSGPIIIIPISIVLNAILKLFMKQHTFRKTLLLVFAVSIVINGSLVTGYVLIAQQANP